LEAERVVMLLTPLTNWRVAPDDRPSAPPPLTPTGRHRSPPGARSPRAASTELLAATTPDAAAGLAIFGKRGPTTGVGEEEDAPISAAMRFDRAGRLEGVQVRAERISPPALSRIMSRLETRAVHAPFDVQLDAKSAHLGSADTTVEITMTPLVCSLLPAELDEYSQLLDELQSAESSRNRRAAAPPNAAADAGEQLSDGLLLAFLRRCRLSVDLAAATLAVRDPCLPSSAEPLVSIRASCIGLSAHLADQVHG
jgi:hypothetical protein